MKNFKQFINENLQNDHILNQIKKSLIMENLVDEDEFNELYGDLNIAWKNFVDNQENGDCQSIVSNIIFDYPNVTKVFGEIEIDEPYMDEYDDEQTLMTHHWVMINNTIYDFSKGTLKNYINWDDVYDVTVENDEWRYQPINSK